MMTTSDTKRIIVVIEHVDARREPPSPKEAVLHMRAREWFVRYRSSLWLVWYQLFIAVILLAVPPVTKPQHVILALLLVGLWEAGMNGFNYFLRRKDVIR